MKTTVAELMAKWEGKFKFSRCAKAGAGIQFEKREPLFALPEFKAGLFEVQDEGSQLVAELVEAKPGEHVLDYCSGSGGKTLAFAPKMKGKGQIYLYDNRPWILMEARKRLRRAGVQNAQFTLPRERSRLGSCRRPLQRRRNPPPQPRRQMENRSPYDREACSNSKEKSSMKRSDF